MYSICIHDLIEKKYKCENVYSCKLKKSCQHEFILEYVVCPALYTGFMPTTTLMPIHQKL